MNILTETGRSPGADRSGWIRVISPKITPPSIKDNTADVDRLVNGIKKTLKIDEVSVDISLVKKIPSMLRESGYDVRPVLYQGKDSWHLIDLFPAQSDYPLYGLAVDLGTSTVVVRVLDLVTQEVKTESSFMNPQNQIGPDILTRINFASQGEGLKELQGLLLERFNEEISKLNRTHGIERRSIVGMSVAGNTTMTHLFLGLDPFWICREPYIPVINTPDLIHGIDLGIEINPHSPVLIFPNVGSYFGGDLVAGILVSGMNRQKEISLMVDVGTNAEVVLGNREWLMGCAGAAGPALEGGVTRMGMMAGPGAIDRVVIDPSSKEFHIGCIGNEPPVGICGSGLIDLAAQLFLAGMIDRRGKFVDSQCENQLQEIDGVKHLVVVYPRDSATGQALTLSQTDIDALMRSKAAMYTILTTITRMVNISMANLENFYISGTFGATIDPKSAITLGMIPDLPIDTYKPLGNTSLSGTSLALVSAGAKDEIYEIRDRITYVELNVNQEFMTLFSAAKFIPHTEPSLFPSVEKTISK